MRKKILSTHNSNNGVNQDPSPTIAVCTKHSGNATCLLIYLHIALHPCAEQVGPDKNAKRYNEKGVALGGRWGTEV